MATPKAQRARRSAPTNVRSNQGLNLGGSYGPPALGQAFEAALNNNAAYGWTGSPVSPDALIQAYWYRLVARSREQTQNNDWVKSYVRRVIENVIGPKGSILRPEYMTNKRKVNPADNTSTMIQVPDLLARRAVSRWWHKIYSRKKNCDFREALNLRDMKKTILLHVVRDGESFIESVYDGAFGYREQIIDPTRCPIEYSDALIPKQNRLDTHVRFGIGYDEFWRPTAYYFRDPEGEIVQSNGKALRRVPAARVRHVFVRDLGADQKRGLPWTSISLLRAKMLHGLEDAAVTKAKSAAADGGWYSSKTGEFTGDEIDGAGNQIVYGAPNEYRPAPEGFELHETDSKSWPSDWSNIEKWNLRAMSAGWGMTYMFLSQDFETVNFSAGKLGIHDEREMWCGVQDWFADENEVEQFEAALGEALFVGIPIANRTFRPEQYERLKEVSFQGRRWPSFEPEKEWKSHAIRIGLNEESVPELIRQSGRDPYEVVDEISSWNDYLEERGLKVTIAAGDEEEPDDKDSDEETDDDKKAAEEKDPGSTEDDTGDE